MSLGRAMLLVTMMTLLLAIDASSAPAYAEWAHHHLVWKSDGHSQQIITEMLTNYSRYNIGVGALNVDSGWSTGYNNFVFDTALFPDPKGLIDFVHGNGQRIVLWVTSMVDTDSSNYAEAVANNYVFNLTQNWWHGHGRLLDFGNPSAVAWWEQQISENLFDKYGCIDGWKCDGTDPWIIEVEFLLNNSWTWPKYANDYYGFFFNFTRRKCGATSHIMSRPSDCVPPGGIGHTGICPIHLPFAPRSVVFMGWVGDQDSTFLGLGVAYGNMMASATAGYISYGSDTGGYRGNGPEGVAKDLFLRWAALNAMMPVFENGGDDRHCPWEFDNETINIYRMLVDFHHTLVPYLYANGLVLAQQPTGSLVTPIATGGHLLGPTYFAYPVLTENASDILFWLPNASTANSTSSGWYLFNSSIYYPSKDIVLMDATELSVLPFFARAGSISVLYDVAGHPQILFPKADYPLMIHVYAQGAGAGLTRTLYTTRDASYLGLDEYSVEIDEVEGRIISEKVVWARLATRRKVSRCVYHLGGAASCDVL